MFLQSFLQNVQKNNKNQIEKLCFASFSLSPEGFETRALCLHEDPDWLFMPQIKWAAVEANRSRTQEILEILQIFHLLGPKNSLRPFILQTKPPTAAGCRFVQTHQNNLYLKSVWQDERALAALARNKSSSTTQRHSCSFCLAASSSQEQLEEIPSIFRDKRSGITDGDVTIISDI